MQRYWSSLRYSFLRTVFVGCRSSLSSNCRPRPRREQDWLRQSTRIPAISQSTGILGIPLPALLSNICITQLPCTLPRIPPPLAASLHCIYIHICLCICIYIKITYSSCTFHRTRLCSRSASPPLAASIHSIHNIHKYICLHIYISMYVLHMRLILFPYRSHACSPLY